MTRVLTALYRVLVRLLPRGFRARNGAELDDAFAQIVATHRGRRLVVRAARECLDVAILAFRLRARQRESVSVPLPGVASTLVEAPWRDLRHAARTLVRMPGFSLPALATGGLGFGAVAAIFNLAWGLWLKPLPYDDPHTLVSVRSQFAARRLGATLSGPEVTDYAAAPSLSGLAAYHYSEAIVDDWGEPARLLAYGVTPELFQLLGVQPLLGRGFLADDVAPGFGHVVILSDRIWRERFNADPRVVGEMLRMRGRDATVVGVMPPGFEFPLNLRSDIWFPFDLEWYGDDRGARGIMAVGRLREAADVDRLRAELAGIATRLERTYPETHEGWTATAVPLVEETVGRFRTAFTLLLAMVGLLLCIATANILGLFIARHVTREHELTVRAALGASAWQLRRLIMMEGLLLGLAGCATGLAAAAATSSIVGDMLPSTTPRVDGLGVGAPVILLSCLVALLVGLLCGFTSDATRSTSRIGASLREGGRGTIGSTRQRLRGGLIVAEVALALFLMVSAALMMRSFVSLLRTERGFEPVNLLTLHLKVPILSYGEAPDRADLLERVVEGIEELPGVVSAAIANGYPGSAQGVLGAGGVFADGRDDQPPVAAMLRAASPGYFATMGTRILAGREFERADRIGAPPVAIVNETLASDLWPGESAVGKHLRLPSAMTTSGVREEVVEIVGVTGNMHLSPAASPDLYVPAAQQPVFWADVVIRTADAPLTLAAPVRAAIRSIDPLFLVEGLEPMTEIIADRLALERTQTILAAMFGALATLLSAVGLYGLLAHLVNQRTRELGVRRALGAEASDIFRIVVSRGLLLTSAGMGAGGLGALAVHRAVGNRFFGLGELHIGVLATAAGTLLFIALLACCLPALRAVRIDPLNALR